MSRPVNYRIETPVESDYLEITNVWEASVRATHHFLTEEDIQFFRPMILNEFLPLVNLRYVKDEKGNILGFMGASEHKVEALFLLPEARGKGIGKKLMHYAISHFKVYKVDVNEDNAEAVGFYQHLGFEVISKSPLDPMGKPFPILHMETHKFKG